jgi:hypothetical protein
MGTKVKHFTTMESHEEERARIAQEAKEKETNIRAHQVSKKLEEERKKMGKPSMPGNYSFQKIRKQKPKNRKTKNRKPKNPKPKNQKTKTKPNPKVQLFPNPTQTNRANN